MVTASGDEAGMGWAPGSRLGQEGAEGTFGAACGARGQSCSCLFFVVLRICPTELCPKLLGF